MHATPGGIANALSKSGHAVLVGEIHAETGCTQSGGNESVSAGARLGFLSVHKKDTRTGFGECRRDGLSHLPFATDAREYHTTSGEIHTPPRSS